MTILLKRTTWLVICVMSGLFIAQRAYAASFDCWKAQSKVEHLICVNPEISKLDEELAASYKAALQNQIQAETIKHAQRQWLNERNNCEDADCVKRAYENRLNAIPSATATIVPNVKQKKRFVVTQGKGYTICESYAQFLNSLPEVKAFPVCHPTTVNLFSPK